MRLKGKKMLSPKPFSEMTEEERYSQLEKLANVLERMRIGDYLSNFNRPMRIIWLNLLGGIAKGVGLTIGATLVIAIIFKLLSALIAMNIPYLTDVLQDVVQIVKTTPGLEKVQSLSDSELQEINQLSDGVDSNLKEEPSGTKSN